MQIKSALNMTIFIHHRSIRPDVFCKTGVLRNFAKFTGKHLCQSRSCSEDSGFIKKRDSGTGVFL